MTLDQLEALADAATPGPWYWTGPFDIGRTFVQDVAGVTIFPPQFSKMADHKFVSAANPATIKQLVELVRLQHGALCAANTNTYFKHAVDALAAYERFEKGEG